MSVSDQRAAAEEDNNVGNRVVFHRASLRHCGKRWPSSCGAHLPECERLLLDATFREAGPAQVVVGGVVQDGQIRKERTRKPADLSIQD